MATHVSGKPYELPPCLQDSWLNSVRIHPEGPPNSHFVEVFRGFLLSATAYSS